MGSNNMLLLQMSDAVQSGRLDPKAEAASSMVPLTILDVMVNQRWSIGTWLMVLHTGRVVEKPSSMWDDQQLGEGRNSLGTHNWLVVSTRMFSFQSYLGMITGRQCVF